ncbi:MAG: LysR family transcriptional regulator, partial [Erysipelotrichaceae bacterium]|nr:LysR family transcriptional regulator [Erysipelotrichaceae bacterium]
MINLNLLEQLITIADCGTLSAAAEKLNISQPALSRAMQKLEEELGCTLFDRYSNRITLNANGKVAVEKARVLLDKAEDFVKEVQDFCHSHEVIHVSSCALAPLLDL